MKLFFGLIRGYYYPSKACLHSRLDALVNAFRFAIECLRDQHKQR